MTKTSSILMCYKAEQSSCNHNFLLRVSGLLGSTLLIIYDTHPNNFESKLKL